MWLKVKHEGQLPVVLASETAECGLACIAMVSRFYGHQIDLTALRKRFNVSITGVTVKSLIAIASGLHLGSRVLRLEVEKLSQLKTPAILHWDLGHFVVLRSATSRRVVIHDPSKGLRVYTLKEASKHFTGIAIEFTPAADFSRIDESYPLKISSLWSRITGLRPALANIIFLSLILQMLAFITPLMIQLVTDQAIAGGDVQILLAIAVGFGLIAVIQPLTAALRDWSIQVLGTDLSYQVMGNLIRHLLRLPVSFFEKRDIGDILSRLGSTYTIQETLTRGALSTVVDGLMAVIAVIILSLYSIPLTSIVLGAISLNLIISTLFYRTIRLRNEEYLVATAVERSHLMESIRAATTIKLLGRESEREGAWRNLFIKSVNSNFKVGRLQIVNDQLLSSVTTISFVIIVYMGARLVIMQQGFSVGMLLAFLAYRQILSDRSTALISQFVKLRLLSLHLERLADIVTGKPDYTPDVKRLEDVRGAVRLSKVGFRYGDADPFILRNIDLDVKAGEFLAITGPSGGGKTTLLKVLLGLWNPVEGNIFLDGVAAEPQLYTSWRERIGVVSQDDRLLSGTISENISFFDPEPNIDRVHEVAALACIDKDIDRMPMKYLSLIGDMGSALSGGQKQRLLLARALYRQPAILVLDEGTANLDVKTETLIADLIADMPITRIVVAHRPALLERADRIVVISGGGIIDSERYLASSP